MGQTLGPLAGLAIALQVGIAEAQDANYPAVTSRTTWCSVPNYRFYRFAPTKARGYQPSDDDPRFTCISAPYADGCMCSAADDCWSGYCVDDGTGSGLSECRYPIVQISEIEFYRKGQKVNTNKVPDDDHDAFRVMNAVDVPQTWGVWELEFYHDTECTVPLLGGAGLDGGNAISSSERSRGFGHSIDHTAPGGQHETARTYWQATQEPPLEMFELHGPVQYAFDGDETTNWWATCSKPCKVRTEWLGRAFSDVVPGGMKCVRILQDKDRDYASFSLDVQGRRNGTEVWDTFATFNAATWQWGGVWEKLSVPQGVAFMTSTTHVLALDGSTASSVVEMAGGTPLDFDFGVETEIDTWRWATAEEPSDNVAELHDGFTCDRDGFCPRDPIRWQLFGCVAATYAACDAESRWETLQPPSGPGVDADYTTTIYRQRFTEYLPLHHQLSLSIEDVWPDGRGKCAARR